jgi:hypothetical protein
MILTQDLKKNHMYQRLELKSAEQAFSSEIVSGTNCSRFESAIIVKKAKEAFRVGEFSDGRVLQDGQMVFYAVSADAPPGVPIERCRKLRIVLSHLNRKEDIETLKRHGAAAKRRQQIMRLAVETYEQGALLTQEDLALLLDSDVRTIRSDIHRLREDQNIVVPTRGTVRDIGPGVTHKHKAVQLWLSGKEALEVAMHLSHSLSAVERYIQTFCRVVYAQRKLRNMLKTAMVVGISVTSANDYFSLHTQLMYADPFYRQRLEEVLELGEAHWEAADGKKNLSRMPGRKSGAVL